MVKNVSLKSKSSEVICLVYNISKKYYWNKL